MSVRKHLPAILIGAAVGVAGYLIARGKKQEPEHIVGPEAEVEPETEAAEPAADAPVSGEPAAEAAQAADETPNVNPVTLGTAEKPLTGDGKLDPTRIASPEDFGDWDDLGCQG